MVKKVSNYPVLLGLTVFAFMTLFACKGNEKKFIPDVSAIQANAEILRFDQDLFNLDTNNIVESVSNLEEKYPSFAPLFFGDLLGVKANPEDSLNYKYAIKGFLSYPLAQQLYDTCQLVFGDFSDIKTKLDQGFKFYKYYLPNREIPEIVTFVSEYTLAAGTYNNQVLIGLDMFLGSDYPFYYYAPLALPNYITRTLNKEHLPSKAFEAIAADLVGSVEGNRLIDHMITNGKKYYLLDLFLPYTADSVRFGITAQQIDWLKENEFQMWQTVFVHQLYDDNFKMFRSLVEPAPTSQGMPNESPGNTGSWVGFQIVKRFMEANPTFTVEQLLAEKDHQKILQGSRYKPR